ncbi:hypothetical protein LTR37_020043 [Vermiconidia calcicola]|uniref:Uncharacterized protein n=1 Tax=Vermiconidia calcicola TaxID=1690605 RepID=A0ACC3ME88_9PEZI|nr:hypothetical protein LTR37_020043 [Vermiconidia calcicola]
MSRQYSDSRLRAIGKLCQNKLPPASAVQAMFLYEMQRETELEKLFQGQMFELARAEDQSSNVEATVRELDERMKALQKQIASKDVEERLATSNTRTDALKAKIKSHDERLHGQAQRLAVVEENVKASRSSQPTIQVAEIRQEVTVHSGKLDKCDAHLTALSKTVCFINSDLETANDDITVLFEERDAMVTLLNQANERIEKLEGLVRALTMQNSSNGSNTSSMSGSPTATQLLPVSTSNGTILDLSVPKGKALVPHKRENIRSFTPGQQWLG